MAATTTDARNAARSHLAVVVMAAVVAGVFVLLAGVATLAVTGFFACGSENGSPERVATCRSLGRDVWLNLALIGACLPALACAVGYRRPERSAALVPLATLLGVALAVTGPLYLAG